MKAVIAVAIQNNNNINIEEIFSRTYKLDLRRMFRTSVAFRLPSRTFLRGLNPGICIQHRLSFNDPFKQHNSNNSICCLRQLSRLWRMFDLFKTISGTWWKERCSISLAEEPISPLLPNLNWCNGSARAPQRWIAVLASPALPRPPVKKHRHRLNNKSKVRQLTTSNQRAPLPESIQKTRPL